jgi:hypothetical protein
MLKRPLYHGFWCKAHRDALFDPLQSETATVSINYCGWELKTFFLHVVKPIQSDLKSVSIYSMASHVDKIPEL